jgi:uncharacterized protein (UPF0216 family)
MHQITLHPINRYIICQIKIISKAKKAGDMVQVAEHLPSRHKTLNSLLVQKKNNVIYFLFISI